MPTNLSAALANRMDYLVARQGVISGNIANADTPGYLAKDISFASAVAQQGGTLALSTTSTGHMGGGGAGGGIGATSTSTRFIQHNGNAVRLDVEMLKMQENNVNYRLATQIYAKQVAMQKTALGRGQ